MHRLCQGVWADTAAGRELWNITTVSEISWLGPQGLEKGIKAEKERKGGADDGTQGYHFYQNSFIHFLHFSQQEIWTRESLSAGHTRSFKLLPCKYLYSRQWVLCISINRNSALFSNTRVFYSNPNLWCCHQKPIDLQPVSTKRLFPTCPDISLQAPCSLLCWFIISFLKKTFFIKTINLGICAGQKAGFKPNYTEIIVESVDNSSSNPKVFTQSCNSRESNFNDVFQQGWEYPHCLICSICIWGLSGETWTLIFDLSYFMEDLVSLFCWAQSVPGWAEPNHFNSFNMRILLQTGEAVISSLLFHWETKIAPLSNVDQIQLPELLCSIPGFHWHVFYMHFQLSADNVPVTCAISQNA